MLHISVYIASEKQRGGAFHSFRTIVLLHIVNETENETDPSVTPPLENILKS